MKTLGSVAAVVAAIREEANAEVDRMEREAAVEMAALGRTRPTAGPDPESDPRVVAARARARDEDSREEWNTGLQDLEDRERWMNKVVAVGRQVFADLSDPAAVKRLTAALVDEAAARLPSGACVLVVPEGAARHLDEPWCVQMSTRIGRQLSLEAGPLTAGCVVRLADRPMAYDNTLEARERRTEVEWRAALARRYAGAIAHIDERTPTACAADSAEARA
jgi:vacuolar-type H+-ATPase subunit E/Vma4